MFAFLWAFMITSNLCVLLSRSTGPSSSHRAKTQKKKRFACYRVVQDSGETCRKAFARKADLQRHETCVHDKDKVERIDCTVKKCNRKGGNGFLRRDHMTEHLRHYHSKDIPKKQRRSVPNAEEDDEIPQRLRQQQPDQYEYSY
ncbi:uncharacterized protein PV09_00871 [Verruconis gallopava]|uniref:C2H2-type domain-containing protein n=1 Tax=Verruconis gallopava TaxID=253628 RepID=A0A0D2AR35_9PEZI|nr:uncharacterized protein PV09_00871 [Verruconis gallopava]KIW08960.1 hypothetical protein PV09_00871 [Verruconis gallopava]